MIDKILEKTKLEKIYDKLKELREEATEDIKFDKAYLEDQFDSTMNIIKWLNKKTDWLKLFNAIEFKKKEAWRAAYEYYKTEYNIKLSTQEEYRLMIESDPSYCTVLQESQVLKEVLQYIDGVIDAMKSRQFEMGNLSKYLMWTRGNQ